MRRHSPALWTSAAAFLFISLSMVVNSAGGVSITCANSLWSDIRCDGTNHININIHTDPICCIMLGFTLLFAGSPEELRVHRLLQRNHSEGEPGLDVSSVCQQVRHLPSGCWWVRTQEKLLPPKLHPRPGEYMIQNYICHPQTVQNYYIFAVCSFEIINEKQLIRQKPLWHQIDATIWCDNFYTKVLI